jgi:hypothetical protein
MGNTASELEGREGRGGSTESGGRGGREEGGIDDGGQGIVEAEGERVDLEGERGKEGDKEKGGERTKEGEEERTSLSDDAMVKASSEEASPPVPAPAITLTIPSSSSSSSSTSSTSASVLSSYTRPRAASSISTTPPREALKTVTPQMSRRYRESESLVIPPISQIVHDQKQKSYDLLSRNPIGEDTFIVTTAARRQALLRQYQHLADVVYADDCPYTCSLSSLVFSLSRLLSLSLSLLLSSSPFLSCSLSRCFSFFSSSLMIDDGPFSSHLTSPQIAPKSLDDDGAKTEPKEAGEEGREEGKEEGSGGNVMMSSLLFSLLTFDLFVLLQGSLSLPLSCLRIFRKR